MNVLIRNLTVWIFSNKVICIYLFSLHILLLSVILNPNLASKASKSLGIEHPNNLVKYNYQSMKTMLARIDKNTKNSSIIFIGDSLIQGLAVNSIEPNAVNFGIGHDNIQGVASRIVEYQSIEKAKAVIISVGINDLRYNTVEETLRQYILLLNKTSYIKHLYLQKILPIDSLILGQSLQNKISRFNKKLLDESKKFSNVRVLNYSDSFTNAKGHLKATLHLGDGLHLNAHGNRVWIKQLKLQLGVHE